MEKMLKVTGMHCKSCEILLADALSEIDGIRNISVNQKEGYAKFEYDNESTISTVKKAIEKDGYKVAE